MIKFPSFDWERSFLTFDMYLKSVSSFYLFQLFLSRGHTIERPHAIDCQCKSCQVKQNSDSLQRYCSKLFQKSVILPKWLRCLSELVLILCHFHDSIRSIHSPLVFRSLSRLNAYKALSSPAYMALSSPDPITTTFELRQEMRKVAHVEKEFHVCCY